MIKHAFYFHFLMSKSPERTTLPTQVNNLNPRQAEVWKMEDGHLSKLNYVHHQSRLQEILNTRPTLKMRSLYDKEEYVETDVDIKQLENELQKELDLLDLESERIEKEIQEAKTDLEDFREERIKQIQHKNVHKTMVQEMHEEELKRMRAKIEEVEADMKLSIMQINYLNSPDSDALPDFEKSFELRKAISDVESESTELKEILNKSKQSTKKNRSKDAKVSDNSISSEPSEINPESVEQ